jgi:hypothetical protein
VGKKKAPPPVEEIGYSSDEVEDYSDAGSFVSRSSYGSRASTSSTRKRLPFHVEKSLITDIEERGGLEEFDRGKKQGLSFLFEKSENSELYGKRGSELREKLGKRVNYFKNNPSAYQKTRETLLANPPSRATLKELRGGSSPAKNNSCSASFQEDHDLSDLEDSFAASVNITPSQKKASVKKKTAPAVSKKASLWQYRDTTHLSDEDSENSRENKQSSNQVTMSARK